MRNVVFIMLFLFLFSGCAYVDQKVVLTYSPINAAKGGRGDLFIVKPVDNLSNRKKENGLVIGTVKSGLGVRTADVVTSDNAADWVTMALIQELRSAGYNVKPVKNFPERTSKGVQITLHELFVDQDTGLATIGAITDLKFNIDVYRDNNKISTINVAAKGDDRTIKVNDVFGVIGSSAEIKGLSLKRALNSAMQQSIPQIVNMLEQ